MFVQETGERKLLENLWDFLSFTTKFQIKTKLPQSAVVEVLRKLNNTGYLGFIYRVKLNSENERCHFEIVQTSRGAFTLTSGNISNDANGVFIQGRVKLLIGSCFMLGVGAIAFPFGLMCMLTIIRTAQFIPQDLFIALTFLILGIGSLIQPSGNRREAVRYLEQKIKEAENASHL